MDDGESVRISKRTLRRVALGVLVVAIAAGAFAIGRATTGASSRSAALATSPPSPTSSTTTTTTTPARGTRTTKAHHSGHSTTMTTARTTTTTAAATTTATVPLPLLATGTSFELRPTTVALSNDATNIVYHIVWSKWTPTSAIGFGTWDYLSCVPNCAQSVPVPYPTTLIAFDPVGGHFTKLTEETPNPPGGSGVYTYTYQPSLSGTPWG